jgi:hypothetical protein
MNSERKFLNNEGTFSGMNYSSNKKFSAQKNKKEDLEKDIKLFSIE